MLLIAQIVFFVVTTLVAYSYWLRPILRSRPQLKAFYAQTDNFWAALRLRFAGLKTQLLAGVSMAATAIVALHDFILTNAFGIDWTPVRDLLPAWAWPFILFADFWLISKFRQMTDRRQKEGL
jgi:hypothetical protein